MKRFTLLISIAIFTAGMLFGCTNDQIVTPTQTAAVVSAEITAPAETAGKDEAEGSQEIKETDGGKAGSASATDVQVSLEEERIIPDQSFDTELNDWGTVRFVSYAPDADFEDVSFFLLKDNDVVYAFPYCYKDNRTDDFGLFDSVAAVGFCDVNHDDNMDVIVITNYITGAGPQGMIPRPKVRIFLSDDMEFYLAADLMQDVTDHVEEKDLTIADICKYLEGR